MIIKDLINKQLSAKGKKCFSTLIREPRVKRLYEANDAYCSNILNLVHHGRSHALRTCYFQVLLIDLINRIKEANKLKFLWVDSGLVNEKQMNLCAYFAAYLHDIGNVINRKYHGLVGSLMSREYALPILKKYYRNAEEMQCIISNLIFEHSPKTGASPTSIESETMYLADKLDISQERVKNLKNGNLLELATMSVKQIDLGLKNNKVLINFKLESKNGLFRVSKFKEKIKRLKHLKKLLVIRARVK